MLAADPQEHRVAQAGADILSISETKVLVAVDDSDASPIWFHPAWALCRALAALGIGGVHLRASGDYFRGISPLMTGVRFTWEPAQHFSRRASSCDIVLHLGNDWASASSHAALAVGLSAQFSAVSWRPQGVSLRSSSAVLGEVLPFDVEHLECDEPSAPIARIAAGLALQEALVVAGRLTLAAAPQPMISFDTGPEATGESQDGSWMAACIENAIVDVIGAGAVGTNTLESLAPMLGAGCELRIFDHDEVMPINLAVQPAYSIEDVGRAKAVVMSEKLAGCCAPGVTLRPIVMRYEDRPRALDAPSLRVACPDTFAARKYVNDCALADAVPLVEAGVSPLVAQVRNYLPGHTACLEHRIPDLSARAANERRRASCAEEQAFTLPGTNMICGGMLALEALKAMRPERFGRPSAGSLVYDARFAKRFGTVEVRPPCLHGHRQS